MPRKPWKSKEIKAGVPVLTDKEMKDVAAVIEVEIGEGKASKHDVATWLIHWFLTQDSKGQLKIARAGKAIEESLKPRSGNPHSEPVKLPSRGVGSGTAKVWVNRIQKPRAGDGDRLDGDCPAAREMDHAPTCE